MGEMTEKKDPLPQALVDRYLFEEVPTLKLSNPKILLSPPLWLLLIAEENVTAEDFTYLSETKRIKSEFMTHHRPKVSACDLRVI